MSFHSWVSAWVQAVTTFLGQVYLCNTPWEPNMEPEKGLQIHPFFQFHPKFYSENYQQQKKCSHDTILENNISHQRGCSLLQGGIC